MAQQVVMPRLGNTVESVVIVEWRKAVGDTVTAGEALCEVETDKTTVEVEAEIPGVLLARLFEAGDEVAVLAPFAVVGEPGESISGLTSGAQPPMPAAVSGSGASSSAPGAPSAADTPVPSGSPAAVQPAGTAGGRSSTGDAPAAAAPGISPRARNLAAGSGVRDLPQGSGPGGRVIERDIRAVLDGRATLTPAARARNGKIPAEGSGIGGRILAADVTGEFAPASSSTAPSGSAGGSQTGTVSTPAGDDSGPFEVIALRGVRQIIARRMHASLLETAQLTLNTSAPAAALLGWRERFKNAPEELGIGAVSLNDLVMFVVTRLLPRHPELNATLVGGEIRRFRHVHLGFAVDTPRGLMVPVIRFADRLSLSALSAEARRLAAACREGRINPDELSGGSFTVTNLGAFGIESFTPVLNTPEVAILGVGTIVNSPVETSSGIGLEKRIGLSLTIDHQAVDGAPGARFLKDLTGYLARPEWAVAL